MTFEPSRFQELRSRLVKSRLSFRRKYFTNGRAVFSGVGAAKQQYRIKMWLFIGRFIGRVPWPLMAINF